jgi:hypothetical protein
MLTHIRDFLRLPHLVASRTRLLLMVYFLVGLGLVFLGAILFAERTTRRMDRQAAVLTRVFSLFVGETALHADRPGARDVIQQVLRETDFPIILSDVNNVPFIWHGVDVPQPESDQPGELSKPGLAPEKRAQLEKLQRLIVQYDAVSPPYPIQVDGTRQGWVHYGTSSLSRQLTWMPAVLVLVMASFAAVGLLVLRYMKLGEQRSIWVGMAKETAHQLGTPLTSLLGWVQLLEDQDGRDESAEASGARRRETYAEMQRDLQRLSKVSARFSKIGATPELVPLDLVAVLQDTVEYIERRIPHLGGQVRIRSELEGLPPVLANHELIEWVFENLLKNALDALESGGEIRLHGVFVPGERAVEIRVADTGKGISPAARSRVFEPGFTTKRRGWGLGLALVRRIVEEYHGGRVWIEDNADKRGVCFTVRLRTA